MTASPTAAARRTGLLPLRVVRRVLDGLETALRPSDALDQHGERAEDVPVVPHRDDTTQEILLPHRQPGGEPAARRASRQAATYLERRRAKLADELDRRR